MERSSSEANIRSADLEVHVILRSPKVHYCGHKNPPLVPILSQINSVHVIFYLRSILILFCHLHFPVRDKLTPGTVTHGQMLQEALVTSVPCPITAPARECLTLFSHKHFERNVLSVVFPHVQTVK
jgi:hypothetical protein